MKDRTWNKIIFVIMAIVLGYFAISVAKADVASELEIAIAKCAAGHAIVGYHLDNEYYIQEGQRWTEYLVGFTEYNEGRTYELVKNFIARGLANLDTDEVTIDDFRELTDTECIKLRDALLKFTDNTIDDWYGE